MKFQRRAYRERAQPESRKKFGLLEKHKDYVLRANAYNRKKEALRRLREKAEFRNPDEFNFKMINSRFRDGIHQHKSHLNNYTQNVKKPDESRFKMMNMKVRDENHQLKSWANEYTKKELMSLKTKDAGYILQQLQMEKKELEKLTATLHSLGSLSSKNKHVKYDEDRETESSHKQLQMRKSRVRDLDKLYMEVSMQESKSRPVYKRRAERKR